MSAEIRVGRRFRHKRQLDPAWRPGPGQRYADAPKRELVVSRITRSRVWYKAPETPETVAGWVALRDDFLADIVDEWLD